MLKRTLRRKLDRGDYKYVALKSSKAFHALSCPMMAGIAEKGRAYFRSYEEAIASGKKACIVCVQEELNLVDKGALSMLQKIRSKAVRTASSVTEQLHSGEWLSERIVSLILSFIYCGLGQIYKRETSKGVCFAIVYTLLIVLVFFFSLSSFEYLFALSALILMWLIGMFDAYIDEETLMRRERWVFWRSLLAVVRFSGIFASAVALVLVASVNFESENDVRNGTRTVEQPDSPGFFYIQVAAFRDSDNAKEYCHELLSNGHQVRIESPAVEGGFHRVLVGEFFNDQDALSSAEKLYEQERFPYMIVRRRTSEKAGLFQTQLCLEIVDGVARVSLDSIVDVLPQPEGMRDP